MENSRINIWAIDSGLALVSSIIENAAGVLYVALSFDDRTLIALGGDQTMVMVGFIENRIFGKTDPHKSVVHEIDLSPDNMLLASGSADKSVRIFDANTLHLKRILERHDDKVSTVVFSPDGRFLASGGLDAVVSVAAVHDEFSEYWRYMGEDFSTVYCVRFSPNSNSLAFTADNTIKFFDIERSCIEFTLKGHPSTVKAIAFSPGNGEFLYSGANDRCIRVWDLTSKMEIGKMEGHNDFVLSLNVHPHGKYLVSSSGDKQVRVWNIDEMVPLSIMTGHSGFVKCVKFSDCGKYVVSAGHDQKVIVWEFDKTRNLSSSPIRS